MLLRLSDRVIRQLSRLDKADRERLLIKFEEYNEKPGLLESNLKIEQAGVYKDFFKRYKKKAGHFRVGDWRVIGIVEKDTFYIVGVVSRGELDRGLARIVRQFPFDLD